ncbi:MAG: ABC transporter permease [Gemmataceae bacterium]
MTFAHLLWRTLRFHGRGNLPVLLGVAVGTAVLTGALLVGDALQGSLRDEALRRLGWVDQALVAPRFFHEALAGEVGQADAARVSPAVLLQATAVAGTGERATYARGVTVLGVGASFFAPRPSPPGFSNAPEDSEPAVWVSRTVADELGVQPGGRITLRLSKPTDVPREAALGTKDAALIDWPVVVAEVLPDDGFAGRFNLRPELTPARNVIVALRRLQDQLGLPGQINAILAAGASDRLEIALHERLTLADWGLVLRSPASRAAELVRRYDTIDHNGRLSYSEWLSTRLRGRDLPRYAWVIEEGMRPASRRVRTVDDFRSYYLRLHPYLSLESRQLLLSPAVVAAADRAATAAGLRTAATLVYLARIEAAGRRVAGVVAALAPAAQPPLGPFLPPGTAKLTDDQIVLVDHDWPATNRPAAGGEVTLRYKPPESHGPTPDRRTTLRLAGWLPLAGAAADPGLTPEFPGITDKEDLGAWELPFDDPEWEKNIGREYGDTYWKGYRATPKGYVTLATGRRLWASRFGALTSLRLALPTSGAVTAEAMDDAAKRFEAALLAELKPADGGLAFDEVKTTALAASRGGTPFGLLFLGFSFFLIAAALLLVGLLFRLNLDRRARQLGVLFATGFTRRAVTGLLVSEGLLLSVVGVAVGTGLALAYSRLLLWLLAALWPGGTLRSFLAPHATATSLLAGAGATLAVSLLTVAWVVRGMARVPPRALLAGQTVGEGEPGGPSPARWQAITAIGCVLAGAVLLLVGPHVPGHEAQAGTFFGSGALFLTAGLLGLLVWMRRTHRRRIGGHGTLAVARLGVRNAARHPLRSMLTVGLLAAAAFLLVAVESFRRHVRAGDGDPAGPDGGFALVGESDLSVIRDLNSPQGRAELLATLRGKRSAAEIDAARQLLEETTIVALRARAGDDASCLNLYQPQRPRVLGVPRSLIDRGGFVFDATLAATADEKANPWRILLREKGPPPAFGEANTVAWMLKSGLGKTLQVPDERGAEQPLLVAGLLHDSVFQSSLLVSEEQFLKLYPGHEGYNTFLIAPPPGRARDVARLLEAALADRGFQATDTTARIEAYLAVENTYLTTFQALGGLGLVLGSLGLAVVLLRAVWERRAELALLRAMGYRRSTLGWLVLAENAFLLAVGLAVGATAALLSITPQLVSGAGRVPWGHLAALFAGVLAVALAAGAAAVMATLRAPLVPALRRE